jgi:hypothetical protein
MSVSNETQWELFTANGIQTTFAIPFEFSPALGSSQIVVSTIVITTGVKTVLTEGALQDYVLDPPYDIVTNPTGPANVIFNAAPAGTVKVLIERVLEYKQPQSFTDTGSNRAKNQESVLDKLTYITQQLAQFLARTFKVNYLDATKNLELPLMVAGYILAVKDDGTGFEFISKPAVVSGGGAGLPPGGVAGDFVEKLSATDNDADWMTGAYDGFSLLTGATFTSTGLKDTLDKIIRITYTAPTISLAASGNGTIREKGDPVLASTLVATIVKKSDPIAQVVFKKSGVAIDTQLSGGAIPSGGSSSYAWSGSFSDNTTFSAEVTDNGATGGPTTVSSSAAFTFVYPYYSGAGAAGLTGAQIALLTKTLIVSTVTVNKTVTVSGTQKIYFAYPLAYGALTSILDINNFETFSDWTRTTKSITGLDGSSQSYYCYEFNNTPVAGDYYYSFRR